MKKKIIWHLTFPILALMGAIALGSCTETESISSDETQSLSNDTESYPSAGVPSIMVNDVLYRMSEKREGQNLRIEVDEADYLGKVTSKIPLSEIPTENDHSNFAEEGTPYIEYQNGIGLLIAGNWVLFEIEIPDE